MDGKRLSRQLRQMMNEESGSNYLDSFTTFDLLNQAAMKLNEKIEHIQTSETLTTVADQDSYTLDADYIRLTILNGKGRELIRYSDGSTFYYIPRVDEDLSFRNKTYTTTSVSIPDSFDIVYDDTEDTQVTGTATSTVAKVSGKTTLNDTAADFSDVEPHDTIHNTTDGSMGVVISKTSTTVLVVALFDGTANDWTSGDAYVIQPQAKYKLVLTPPPSTANESVIVPYLKRPKPVYSDYDQFQFPIQYMDAIVFYAVGFYKYRHQMNAEGNMWFGHADNLVRQYNKSHNTSLGKRRISVNLKKKQRNY
jgi:hypothetical protein